MNSDFMRSGGHIDIAPLSLSYLKVAVDGVPSLYSTFFGQIGVGSAQIFKDFFEPPKATIDTVPDRGNITALNSGNLRIVHVEKEPRVNTPPLLGCEFIHSFIQTPIDFFLLPNVGGRHNEEHRFTLNVFAIIQREVGFVPIGTDPIGFIFQFEAPQRFGDFVRDGNEAVGSIGIRVVFPEIDHSHMISSNFDLLFRVRQIEIKGGERHPGLNGEAKVSAINKNAHIDLSEDMRTHRNILFSPEGGGANAKESGEAKNTANHPGLAA